MKIKKVIEDHGTGCVVSFLLGVAFWGIIAGSSDNNSIPSKLEKIAEVDSAKSIILGKRQIGTNLIYVTENDGSYTLLSDYLQTIPDKYDKIIEKNKIKKIVSEYKKE